MTGLGPLLRRWALAVVWLTLPFTAGPALADALDPRSRPVQVVASVGLWVLWAATLAAALVPRTVSLTVVRIVAPASVLAALWAAVVSGDGAAATQSVAMAVTSLAAVLALWSQLGDEFVNGSSYGEERRMLLRPPGALLLGPLESMWLLLVVGAVAGPLLLASRQWVLGGVVLVVGWAWVVAGSRLLHRLAQRWVVFVPAGIVIVDRSTITDALLLQRPRVARLGPAAADTAATDLTAGALGLALELRFTEPETLTPAAGRPRGDAQPPPPIETSAVLFTPSRPGEVLAEARRRRLPVD